MKLNAATIQANTFATFTEAWKISGKLSKDALFDLWASRFKYSLPIILAQLISFDRKCQVSTLRIAGEALCLYFSEVFS